MEFIRRNCAMTTSSRALIALSLFLIWPLGAHSEASEANEKEQVPEKSAPGAVQAPAGSDSQPAAPKPAPETKPHPPTAPVPKSEPPTEHKEGVPVKPAPGASQLPAASDGQPVSPKPAPDVKPPPQAVPVPKSDTSTEHKHKEGVPEKPASDGQSAPQKPAQEAKPQPPPAPKTKNEAATEHKEGAPEKSGPRVPQTPAAADGQPATPKPSPDAKPQPQAPTIKADLPPDQDVKDKEPALRKTLGSLILSVKLALMGDSRLFHYEIEVEDDQQTITLSGRVSTEDEKAAAKDVAQKVPGVKSVVNKLSVEKDLAKTLSKKQDDALTSLIKERFSKSATLKAANFEVKTEDGVVLIQGTVRFQVIALEAAEAARQVPGVRAVNTEKVRLEGES
jgi:osmotically-inducible protein OsmY